MVNHSIEGRDLFLDTQDYARFVHNLYEFNTTSLAHNTERHSTSPMSSFRNCSSGERVVKLHAWCLMRNHYHLLLSPLMEGALTFFMRRVNIGFANYVNERYHRHGTLLRGKTRKVPVLEEQHGMYVINYIHLNPLDYHEGSESWRSFRIEDAESAEEYLRSYKWSSLRDYLKDKNFPSLIDRSFYESVYSNYARSFIRNLKDLSETEGVPASRIYTPLPYLHAE